MTHPLKTSHEVTLLMRPRGSANAHAHSDSIASTHSDQALQHFHPTVVPSSSVAIASIDSELAGMPHLVKYSTILDSFSLPWCNEIHF